MPIIRITDEPLRYAIGKVNWARVHIDAGRYDNGRIALELIDATDGQTVARATVNVPHEECAARETFVKEYNENAGIGDFLTTHGIIERGATGETRSGFVIVYRYRLTPLAFARIELGEARAQVQTLAALLSDAVDVLGPEEGWETDDSPAADFFRRAIPELRSAGIPVDDQAKVEARNQHADAAILADSIIAELVKWPNEDLAKCKTFADLHEHCDANMLGNTADVFNALGGGSNPAALATINQAQAIVDAWLRARNALPRQETTPARPEKGGQ